MGGILERKFYGKTDIHGKNILEPGSWRLLYSLPWLISKFLFQCLLLPVFILMAYCPGASSGCSKKLFIDPRRLPVVTFYSCMVSYIVFLGLLTARIVEESPLQIFSWFDGVVLLYLPAMVVEEIYQITKNKEKRRYLTIANGCDWAMILCFSIFYVIRVIGKATDNLTLYRVSEHFFAVAVALSFLRLLYFMQVNRKLGPILFSFTAILAEIVSFVSILGIMLIAFGIAVTVVYHAGVYTVEFQNGSIALPYLVRGLVGCRSSM